MKAAFAAARDQPWFADLAGPLELFGFQPVERRDFRVTLERDRAAIAASYPLPA